jgi:hypothetical protein
VSIASEMNKASLTATQQPCAAARNIHTEAQLAVYLAASADSALASCANPEAPSNTQADRLYLAAATHAQVALALAAAK